MRFPVSEITPAKTVESRDPVVRVAIPRNTLLPAVPDKELMVLLKLFKSRVPAAPTVVAESAANELTAPAQRVPAFTDVVPV